MLPKTIASTRYLMILPVLGSLAAGIALSIYGVLVIAIEIVQTFQYGEFTSKTGKLLALTFIETLDLFLISAACYIIGVGLYELFINNNLPLPNWLEVHDLDDLKDKLVKVIVAALAVYFLGKVATWDGASDLLGYGVAVASMIAALTYFLGVKASKKDKSAG